MIIYHFTASIFLDGIFREGITKGKTPIIFKDHKALVLGHQWLTKKRTFTQEWCQNDTLPYDRSEVRLDIKIPEAFQHNLMDYKKFEFWLGENKFPYFYEDDEGNFCEDCVDWMVYFGNIPKQWIKKTVFKK